MIHEIEKLFAEQVRDWPRLSKGVGGLAQAQTRLVRIGWFDVHVRHIPHRVVSTTARVDRESILKRPCFLCRENLDPEEKGIPFGRNHIVYFNPFPIVERHLTIVHREHGEQRIAGSFGDMLDLAEALPGYFVIYNGPECGASAPDHLHFQAGLRNLFPIEHDTAMLPGPAVNDYDREVLLLRSTDRTALIRRVEQAMNLLASITNKKPEPLVNIAVYCEGGRWTVFVFPRGKHRPNVFHTGELTVSPGAIDLCGIIVVPLEKDFARISGEDIAAILREVTLPSDQFSRLLAGMEQTV